MRLRNYSAKRVVECNSPVLSAHALNTGTNTNVNHASTDLVGDINARLKARRALAVESANGCGFREAGEQSGGTHLGGTTAGREHGANADILNKGRVDLGAVDNGLEDAGHDVGGLGVLETTLAPLGECASAASGDNNLSSGSVVSLLSQNESAPERREIGTLTYIVRALLEDLLAATSGGVARELAPKLGDSVQSWGRQLAQRCPSIRRN